MTEPDAGPEPDGWAAATTELEAILREVEDRDVDVDVLAARVERASFLIEWCRTRILRARVAVDAATGDGAGDA